MLLLSLLFVAASTARSLDGAQERCEDVGDGGEDALEDVVEERLPERLGLGRALEERGDERLDEVLHARGRVGRSTLLGDEARAKMRQRSPARPRARAA